MRNSIMIVVAVVLVMTLSSIGTLAESSVSSKCTISVSSDQSIQAAIEAAPDGAVICLEGVWRENLVITKNLTLQGVGVEKAVINGAEKGKPVILIESDAVIDVRIIGLVVAESRAGDPMTLQEDGILISGQANVQIEDCQILGNILNGIEVQELAQLTVKNCQIFSNDQGAGVSAAGSTQATITNCTISGNGDGGVYLFESANCTIDSSHIWGNPAGVAIGDSAQLTITNSQVSENREVGILIAHTAQVTLIENTIDKNGGYGVALYQKECFDEAYDTDIFRGYVTGHGNTIPGLGEPDGNHLGTVCPNELEFLSTEAGGELDRLSP